MRNSGLLIIYTSIIEMGGRVEDYLGGRRSAFTPKWHARSECGNHF